MTTLIKNSVIHFAKVLKVYTVLALVGVGVVVLAQLGASLRHYYSIENVALTVGIILICLLLVLKVLTGELNAIIHIPLQTKKAKHKPEEAGSPDITPRLKKS